MKINRAYEILKDEELRKKYDQFGEKGLHDENRNYNNYQNWNYYQQNFGIYDEDPEIITLSRSDFRKYGFYF
jgi:DnaJ family protein C protein 10